MADECKRGGAGSWVRGRLGQPGVIATAIIGVVLLAGGVLAAGTQALSSTPKAAATAAPSAPATASGELELSTYDPITPMPVVRVEHYPRYSGEMTGVEKVQWMETFGVERPGTN
jgi:hypothetical protein